MATVPVLLIVFAALIRWARADRFAGAGQLRREDRLRTQLRPHQPSITAGGLLLGKAGGAGRE